jgi:hypothetical protein
MDDDFVLQQFGNRMASQGSQDLLQYAPCVPTVITNESNSQFSQLKPVQIVNFPDSYLESRMETVLDAANNLALIFQAPGLPDQQPDA